MEQDVIAK